jgi:hypothetical protein
MARCLDIPVQTVNALADLQWIERDMRSHELRTGKVSFR